MSAPVTEAHKQLVATIVEQAFRFAEGNHKITPLSQLIADSEAKAVAEWQSFVHLKGEAIDSLLLECNQLRAEVERLRDIGCVETLMRAERAEAELKASRYETVKAAQEGLRECIRAERAEAELAKVRAILASIEEDGTEEHNAAVRLRQELATERARLDWLGSDAGMEFQWETTTVITRAAIDAAMKEGAK